MFIFFLKFKRSKFELDSGLFGGLYFLQGELGSTLEGTTIGAIESGTLLSNIWGSSQCFWPDSVKKLQMSKFLFDTHRLTWKYANCLLSLVMMQKQHQ